MLGRLPDDPDAVRAALHAEGASTPSRRWAISWTSCGREKNPRSEPRSARLAHRPRRRPPDAQRAKQPRGPLRSARDARRRVGTVARRLRGRHRGHRGSVLSRGGGAGVVERSRRPTRGGAAISSRRSAIMKRERLTRRSAALKRTLARWPQSSALVDAVASTPSRTRLRRRPAART